MIIDYGVPLPTQVGIVEQYEYQEEIDYMEIFEEGEIMKPIETNNLTTTSGYTGSSKYRTYKINGKTIKDHHYGIDLVGGTKIIAVASGRVVQVVNKGSKGGTMCLVRIQHKDYQSAYYHLKSGSIKVKVGQWVAKGTHIATIGNTGKSSGTHLHFQIDKGSNGSAINPKTYAYGEKELEGLYSKTTNWEAGDYRLLFQKYLRTTPRVEAGNKYKWNNLTPNAKAKCVKDALGYAKYKVGADINIKEFEVDSKGNVWGRTNTLWVCLKDSSGDQVIKL